MQSRFCRIVDSHRGHDNRILEVIAGLFDAAKIRDGHCTRRLTEDCDFVLIAAEIFNIRMNPSQCFDLIEQPEIIRGFIRRAFKIIKGRSVDKAMIIQSVGYSNQNCIRIGVDKVVTVISRVYRPACVKCAAVYIDQHRFIG